MPPKKAALKPGAQDAIVEEKKNELDQILRECDAYERMMVVCSEQMQRSNLEILSYKKKIAALNSKFEEQEKQTHEKCIGMYKVYRSGKAQLLTRIEAHQVTIEELRRQLYESKSALERTKAEKDIEIAGKTRAINEQKQKMEEMAIAFGIKLKETLERMSQHIRGKDDL
eukprot:Tbor_TRINITY_DN4857_c0_g1::TRINITY_DN4857_c0_g1_i1::g.1363::m.1363